ncbi:MAG: UDP-3-O-acyl-N-acetylglucosamine deacetylase [Candidatus Magnetobacterium sp. LHC-1]|uniref:UDP-3-O-acyl-N-acetylglucosamine deacetylase n=1 Tax=Candidatus Magnetobacterium casense TaxID=1455061 RepID=A0ABS6RVA2_9BACT|nr:UDP-3-O-acyl-N-acetylglucosamine deacetylase [Candidatus Magnetobacterium casensis]MBF0608398.1 UDP-3-O-[3-hydroxymyristoyl] N-acetylglucosamine deacetylase [Nitrospirota bacterium]MBV6340557.1 UDP-3-O-[3-hydroxymyristoyl] N-acetylglucosamine deacetylase [Candidatus Magnetobacterium casensis]
MRSQRTIKRDVSFEGVGLHTGAHCRVHIRQAPIDNGIVFHKVGRLGLSANWLGKQRLDRLSRLDKLSRLGRLSGYKSDVNAQEGGYCEGRDMSLVARVSSVVDTAFATTLGNGREVVRTVEHLLAVLSALSIDNVDIAVEGSEIPILDGSAKEIAELVLDAGIKKQRKKMPFIKILSPIKLEDKHSSVAMYPYEGRKITFRLFFDDHFLGEQYLSIDLNADTFIEGIAPARTFGFLKDVEYIRANGLAKGGSLDNAVIFTEDSVVNESGLRFEDECVRHKILDSIGDFSLFGFPIEGHIVADKSGHTTNVKFLKKLMTSPECWEIVAEEVQSSRYPVLSYSYI